MRRPLLLLGVLFTAGCGRTTPYALAQGVEAPGGDASVCSDGNTRDGDGCSASCRALR